MSSDLKASVLTLAASLGLVLLPFGLARLVTCADPHHSSPLTDQTLSTHPANAQPVSTVDDGARFFANNCAHCHGDDARGDEGPDLHGLAKSDARIASIVQGGIKGEMPAFGKKFSQAELHALVRFLRSLGD